MKVQVVKFCNSCGVIKIDDKHIRRFDLSKENNYVIDGKKYYLYDNNINDLSLGQYTYAVDLESEYNCDLIYDLRDKYTKWFDTKKQAIEYARSIKKELKQIIKDNDIKDNTITLDINEYIIDGDFCGTVYSLNILGKY